MPNTTEIIDELSVVVGLTDQLAAAQARLEEILSGCDHVDTEGNKLSEAKVIIAGLAAMPGRMMVAIGNATDALDAAERARALHDAVSR